MRIDLTVGGYILYEDKILLIHHKKLGLWLVPGGHIEPGETPDQAIIREIKEEVGLDVDLVQRNHLPVKHPVIREMAIPFHANIHSVGDHLHYCTWYLCKPRDVSMLLHNPKEVNGLRWVAEDELEDTTIPDDVRNIAYTAFRIYHTL